MPRLSVLLPVRNAQETIRQAVSSTLRDLPPDSEVLVLDDGSSDDTRLELERIDDPRLRVMESPGTGNLAGALNMLLASTDSELISRMDADDITLPGRFSSSLAALQRGADLVFTSAVTTRGLRLRPSVPLAISAEAFPLHLLLSNPVRHPSLTARRSALQALGGYRDLPSEDYDLWLRAAQQGCAQLKTGWYGLAYRVHPSQISSGADWRKKSRADEELQRVFAQVSAALLGRPFPRLVRVETSSPEEAEQVCVDFGDALRRAMLALKPVDRAYLTAKWHRRRVQVLRESRLTLQDRTTTSE